MPNTTPRSATDAIDLDRYPIDRPDSAAYAALVRRARDDLARDGMFNLPGFMPDAALAETVAMAAPRLNDAEAFTHARRHNIYFQPPEALAHLPPDHPALAQVDTRNHTLCADQVAGSAVDRLYSFPPMAAFLAATMGLPALYTMDDPLARLNVMGYHDGWTLNWHFDRSQFTTTLLLQAPLDGGEFVYRTDLRSDTDPNYDGVARLLRGQDPQVRTLRLDPGTLNVFKGRNTPHKVAPVRGPRPRIIAVLSYYDRPGVSFTTAERLGFYGRAD